MSREYTVTSRQREAAEAACASYVAAHEAVAKARAGDFLLREIEARTTELLESRQRIERAKRELANARAAVIQGAWTNGMLAGKLDLGAAVAALLAGASA
jgi:hypothetical protein